MEAALPQRGRTRPWFTLQNEWVQLAISLGVATFITAWVLCGAPLPPWIRPAYGSSLWATSTGAAAERNILDHLRRHQLSPMAGGMPPGVREYWHCEWTGCAIGATTDYWAVQCDSPATAREVLKRVLDGRRWEPLETCPFEYGVVVDGPRHYADGPSIPEWGVRAIRDGLFTQHVEEGRHGSIEFYAIDFDRLRVYGLFECGGFHEAPPLAAEAVH